MKKMYHNNTRSFALLFILLVFLLGGIVGYGLSIYKFEVSGKIYDSCSMNCPNPDPVIRPNFSISTTCPPLNYSKIENVCPEPNVTKEVNIDMPYKNIQGSHHNIDYNFEGDDLCIDDTDTIMEMNGNSMQPTIFTGHEAIIKDYEDQILREGMIIIYDTERGSIGHRISGNYLNTNGYVTTRGDNNQYFDTVYPENITGIVVGVLYDKLDH